VADSSDPVVVLSERTLFETSAVGIAITDGDRRFLECNQTLATMLGYDSPDELVGISGVDLTYPADTAEIAAAIDALRRAPSGEDQLDRRYRRKDGAPIALRLRAAPIPGTGMFFSFFEDVTAQKQAELDALRRAQLLDRAQEIAQMGAYVINLERETILISAQFARLLRAGDEEFELPLAEYRERFYLPERRELATAQWQERYAAGEERVEVGGQLVRADGERIWVRSVEARTELGDETLMLGITRDVTAQHLAEEQRRELEDRLRQSQKLDALGQLAGGVAHDFNNLLTVIAGATTLALLDIPDGETREHLEEAVHAAERASELTRKLLVFARRQPVEQKTLDLNEVVTDARRLLERLIEPAIEISVELTGEPLPVVGDIGQLEQVLLNLALNARDAMPRGGRLTIRTRREAEREQGVISVEDTGVGMAPGVVERIFEPFFTTKAPDKGTGLGLATVFGIVDAAGGDIDVATEVGVGTCFTVRWPLGADDAVEATKNGAGRATGGVDGGGLRALLVDDDEHVRRTLARVLRAAGCGEVVALGSGAEALAHIANDAAFDVLVTDLIMPAMNGIDFAAAIRARSPSLPILFVSGSSENARLAASQPNAEFLAKPVTIEAIAAALSRLVPR